VRPGLVDKILTSWNALAISALATAARCLRRDDLAAAAAAALRAAWGALQRYPEGHASMLQALEDYLDPPRIIVLRGPAAALDAWREALEAGFNPRRWTLAVPTGLADLPAALADKPPGGSAGEAVVAYICRGLTCGAAIGSLAQLQQQLHALDTGVD